MSSLSAPVMSPDLPQKRARFLAGPLCRNETGNISRSKAETKSDGAVAAKLTKLVGAISQCRASCVGGRCGETSEDACEDMRRQNSR